MLTNLWLILIVFRNETLLHVELAVIILLTRRGLALFSLLGLEF